MATRLAIVGLLTALALAAGTFAGCGGDGGGDSSDLTLDEYFAELEERSAEFEERGRQAEDDLDFVNAGTEAEQVELAVEFFTLAVTIYEDFVSELDDLNPPAEVQSVHEDAVSNGRTAVERLRLLLDLVGDAETEAELDAALEEVSPADPVFETFSAACVELQGIADERGIDVDLQCG